MTINVKRVRTSHISLAHLVAIIIVGLSVFLIVDFGIKAAELFQANQQARDLENELNRQHSIRQTLQKRLDYVQSDAYVEEVARNELRWSLPGDTMVVVMSPPPEAPVSPEAAQPRAGSATPPAPSWVNWWSLFFDGAPPRIF